MLTKLGLDTRWAAACLAIAPVIAALDLAVGSSVTLIGFLSLPPLAAAVRARPAATVTIAVASTLLAVLCATLNGSVPEGQLLVSLAVSLLGGLAAVILATARQREEKASAAARRGEALHQAMLRSAIDAVVTMDHEGRVLEFNEAAEETFGYDREDAIGREVAELIVPPSLRGRYRAALAGKLDKRSGNLDDRMELTGMRSDGSEFPVELAIAPIEGAEPPIYTGYLRDITERHRAEERLTRQALHDVLTGVPGRTLFLDRLGRALTPKRGGQSQTAVLFVDLDRFKAVNDSLGHATADLLLVELARRCQAVIRPEDTLARMSGDEFTILCSDVAGEDEALAVAARINEAIEAHIQVGERRVQLTASIGVAIGRAGVASPDALLSDANTAMYSAKQEGSAAPVLFDAQMRSSAGERMRLEEELSEAFERDELVLHYQPQVDLRTGRAVGVEALVRWDHPVLGLLAPADFIPIAEQSGLVVRLGEVVLEQACDQARRWASERGGTPFTVAVNLSPQQFANPALPGMVEEALERSSLPGDALCLEITERTLVSEGPATAATLAGLSGMGVRLAIDDFGIGYSSLSYLQLLPVNTLKVDAFFVDGLARRRGNRAIVGAVVQMAHALGMEVVAEGVETYEQVEELRVLDCDQAQGFRFARPQPPERLEAIGGDAPAFSLIGR
jgi:diguanylate cyclase (GGDEF)-like protein/PAS domain S-box-containing protein